MLLHTFFLTFLFDVDIYRTHDLFMNIMTLLNHNDICAVKGRVNFASIKMVVLPAARYEAA